jgi:hypothetical protein
MAVSETDHLRLFGKQVIPALSDNILIGDIQANF